MEINTANQDSHVYLLNYTCQQQLNMLTGTLDVYETQPKARRAMRAYAEKLLSEGYDNTLSDQDHCILFRDIDRITYHFFIEKKLII